jgi:Flp pilus assembly protein TadD
MPSRPARAWACGLFLLGCGIAAASDAPPQAPWGDSSSADPLAAARGHVAARRWKAALDELRKLNLSADADWHNLMGYALRKQAAPDLDGAQQHYDAALRLNPKHQGALEYSGELALMKGDLATAEARLATLATLCRSPCEPLDDLRKAIAGYKSKSGR